MGAALSVIVDDLITGSDVHGAKRTRMDLGVPTLPAVLRDNTDRNRTSPFAFTGNKFEFRMCGSQQNLSDPNVILNTIVAEQCDRFANDLEDASEENFTKEALSWVIDTFKAHERILFEGNGYSGDWEKLAEERAFQTSAPPLRRSLTMVAPETLSS